MIQAFQGQLWLLLLIFICKNFFLISSPTRPTVLVSVAPHKFFIEKIAQETVHVHLMVPAGASSHTYEPTPKQMVTAGQADIWFRIGEPFENRAVQALKSHHPTIKIVNLQQGLDLIQADHCGHNGCCQGSVDLHFWLSARQGLIQAKTIADTLIETYPEHQKLYHDNLYLFQNELRELDQKIQKILTPLTNRSILVSHPAYAYFCRDYDLMQYSIEVEGKDPTPQQMTRLFHLIRQFNIKAIFIQIHYNNKAAKLVAEAIGAKLILLDPYSEHYMQSMLEIAHAFTNE